MSYESYLLYIFLAPLAGFLILSLTGKRIGEQLGGLIGTGLLALSFALSLYTAYNYFYVQGTIGGAYQQIIPFHHTWLVFYGNLSIDMGIMIDPLSVMMLVVVTGVSFMVHLFSMGYMKGEQRHNTYFAYLGLFTFSMLGLVASSNIFQIYIFWELVGVSSFLLIGYYFTKPSAVAAAKKAFVVTRFADLGFLIGILMISYGAGSLDFNTIIAKLTGTESLEVVSMSSSSFLGLSTLTWALTLIFIGGAGKSAMFPLHIWLPDAMEGPTPVSALIHAATMVVAGVYLVARMFPVFVNVPVVMELITWVGIISAVMAAIIACTQTDIKRVLAYSTMSQIGFMMFGLGVSKIGAEGIGYIGSLFHLFTHAFFKSLLFLGAGSVIHMVHSNEMRDMGGLRKLMPVTHITFLIACLAIAGVPPLSGFFSKEEILLATWEANKLVYFLALFTSGLTAFYMFRLYFSIFHNKASDADAHHGEGTWTMKLPLMILCILTIAGGWVPFAGWVTSDLIPSSTELHLTFSIAPVLMAIGGISIAAILYFRESDKSEKITTSVKGIYQVAYNKFYIDEVYFYFTKSVLFNVVGNFAASFDRKIVDGAVNAVAYITCLISELIRGIQSGKVQNYGIYFIGGIICLSAYFIYRLL
jgi:NADH-quinone oxidoreductase subunit L